MTLLDKLNFQTVSRQIERDPVAERRARFRACIAEQRLVLAGLARVTQMPLGGHEDLLHPSRREYCVHGLCSKHYVPNTLSQQKTQTLCSP